MFSLKRIVIKDYLFMIIENLIESFIWRGSVKGFHHMFYLKRIVIKDYLFMIIENLIESFIWMGSSNGFSERVQWTGSVNGFSEGVHRMGSVKGVHRVCSLWNGCHKGSFVYDYWEP